MKRFVSKKSENMLRSLMVDTREMIISQGNADWAWSNTYLSEDETENVVRDMLRLLESKTRDVEIKKRLNIITSEKAELETSVIKIVCKRLENRMATYREAI